MSKKTTPSSSEPNFSHHKKIVSLREHKLVRYILVGGGAYVIEMSTLYILRNVFEMSSLRAVAISFWVGFFAAFFMQKLLTFKNYDTGVRSMTTQFLGYSALVAFNYAFTLLIVGAFNEKINVYVLRTAIIATITIWNFYIYSKLFRQSSSV